MQTSAPKCSSTEITVSGGLKPNAQSRETVDKMACVGPDATKQALNGHTVLLSYKSNTAAELWHLGEKVM